MQSGQYMIPDLKREHVERALQRIDTDGVPLGRNSKRYFLLTNGRKYPPKYVLSLAFYYAYGRELRPEEFSGGKEANSCLQKLGYKIEAETKPQPTADPEVKRPKKIASNAKRQHDERCPSCKEKVYKMLQTIYGMVERNYHLDAGTLPEHYANSPWQAELQAIFQALASHRGFGEFVKTSNLSNCDYFVPDPGFIVEFDESQHFTECRRLTLERYPQELRIGYNLKEWIANCEFHKARDNDPPYRDEQRAWYDTLRDFLPSMKGFHPTIRLYSRDTQWCKLNPADQTDIDFFKSRLEMPKIQSQSRNLRLMGDSHSAIGRIIIEGPWSGEIEVAAKLLEEIAKSWPQEGRVEFLMTPGAFIRFGNPNTIPKVPDNTHPNPEIVDLLYREVRAQCMSVLTAQLRERLKNCTRYLTLGVDSRKSRISQTQQFIAENHVEMVCLVDLQTGDYHITGKSYPTPQQQHHLLRIPDLESHFCSLDSGNVMILGCHDLTIFNPRAQAVAKGWRNTVNRDFRRIAKERQPRVVLHHPHTTIKRTTWLHAWNGLLRELPSVQIYAGTGRYSSDDSDWANRHPLSEVLQKTASMPTLDIIVRT